MKRLIVVLAAMLFISACEKEKPAKEFSIQGKVVEMQSQAPVAGVNLKLYSGTYYEGEYVLWVEIGSATTYDTGYFQIGYNLYGGAALLTFSGLAPRYKKVRVNGGDIRYLGEYFYIVVQDGGNYTLELIQE